MNIEIANKLFELRKKYNYSQEDLAEKIGVSRQAVSKWERAEASPDTENLILLARLYGVSIDELLSTNEPVEAQSGQHHFENDTKQEEKFGEDKTLLQTLPYPVFVTIIYLVIGFFGEYWHPGWIVFLTIPIYYSVVEWYANKKR